MINKTKKLHFWLRPELLKRIEAESKRRGVSRNVYIETILSNYGTLESMLSFYQDKIEKEGVKK